MVRAGLIPWLAKKYGTDFTNLMFTPDTDPFESFYASLLGKYSQAEAKIAREVKAETLVRVANNLKQPDDFWFIFIDQFEELFTASDENKRHKFINGLMKLSKAKLPNLKIMATMRADFLERLSDYPQLVEATQQHRPMIVEMQHNELRVAIEQPAANHGVVFEAGLVDKIIAEIQGQAGCLPLLQYTLNLLWEDEVKTGKIDDRTLNLTSGSYDRTIILWDVETGEELRTLKGHDSDVFSISFSPDGQTLASGSNDNKIKLWDVETGKELRTLTAGLFHA